MSSLLPTTNRDVSPTPTVIAGGSSSNSHERVQAPSTRSGSTQVGGEDMNEKQRSSDMSDEKAGMASVDEKAGGSNEYEDKGVIELDEAGRKRQVRVVLENKTGKEVFKEMAGGEYTIPRWRHSLPFIKPKHGPPPPPLSLDDPPVTPEVTANLFSTLFFNWVSPMMALGSARPLQATDLWKMDEKRSAGLLADRLSAKYHARQQKAIAYNTQLADPKSPLPYPQRLYFGVLPHREKREHDFRTKHGKKKASLAWALSDTFGWYFWSGGLIKVISDASTSTTPLVMRAIISWSTQYHLARAGQAAYPSIGRGVGMAIGLFCMLCFASIGVHHFFVRGMATGVMARSAIITAVFNRALRLTQKSRGNLPNGKLVNHISTDTSRIDFAAGFFHMTWTAVIMFIVITIILIVEIGYSALPGIGFLLVALPMQTLFMKRLFGLRKKSMEWTDKRAKLLQEILGGMRIVKFMAWEVPFLERLGAIREMELGYVRRLLTMRSAMMAFAMSLPVLAAILSFITYKLTSHSLQAPTIFSVVTLFQLMRMPLMIWPMSLSATADALNAISRLEVVFEAETLTEGRVIDPSMEDGVRIDNASFTWDAAPVVNDSLQAKLDHKQAKANGTAVSAPKKQKKARFFKWNKKSKKVTLAEQAMVDINGGAAGPSGGEAINGSMAGGVPPLESGANIEEDEETTDRVFKISEIDLAIPRGSLTAIVGPIGSGKSSLLQGLMGEMRKTEGKVTFSGSTALCAQTPWIQNATVRENILFGQRWDEERYWAAVRDSCLEPDLELLEDGDGTEIGEKGINLSGGQKQRVNIARAIYLNADIIALDDPLSALDAGVGKALFYNAIIGALSGKTRILVTHALHFLPYVDNIIVMDDGHVGETGTYTELRNANGPFSRLIRDFGSEDEHDEQNEDEAMAIEKATSAGKHERVNMVSKGTAHALMQTEERKVGAAKGDTWLNYFKAGRGGLMIPFLIFAIVVAQCFTVLTSFWLVYWQERKWQYGDAFYMGIYAGLGLGSALSLFFAGFTNALLNYFASVRLHKDAITRVMFAPQSFFDTTPLGRIMNRFAKDIDTIDNTLADAMRMAVSTLGSIIGATVLLAIVEPWFLLAFVVIVLLYAHNAAFYRRSSREFKRIDAILRSSLYSHFSESLSGIATIRSYGESQRFFNDNIIRMDIENRAYYLTIINQRWLGIRLDFLGSLLTFAVAIIVIFAHNISPANGGLGLSVMLTVQQSFSWLVRQLAEVENDMVGAERIMHYANELEQEAPHQLTGTKPASSWPTEGRIEFDAVRMKYRPELPDVLKGLTMSVGAAEKIGVVGRTGAGKSSIMVSLFRMSELSAGTIKIDGVDVSKIGLNDLRSGISIIPQDPLLFSGTLRTNIDPFNTRTDADLYDALKRAHLVPSHGVPRLSMGDTPSGAQTPLATGQRRFTLDTVIEEEGGNLSVGERSLVSLARALVRGSKVLVLDEATASVDVETDAKIQQTIRDEFGDRTLLCIAHRLRTILSYDRILVMADGAVEEFDTPENLFHMNGAFTTMCEKSGITIGDLRAAAALRF